MRTLQTWIDDGKSDIGWSVNGTTHDTGGLGAGDVVIYHSDENTVTKRDGSPWGIFAKVNDTKDKIAGTVKSNMDWSFEITCVNGGLQGVLSGPVEHSMHFGGSHHRGHGSQGEHPRPHDDHDGDGTPGSWTTAEDVGTGSHFHRERERAA